MWVAGEVSTTLIEHIFDYQLLSPLKPTVIPKSKEVSLKEK
jgi:hypothetical protein